MEQGSRWPSKYVQSTNVVAVADDAIAQSDASSLAGIERHRGQVKTAILSCNGSVGNASRDRRGKVGAALLHAVEGVDRGRIVLHASDKGGEQLQADLLALADSLSSQLRGTSTTIQVHFASSGGSR